MDITTEQLIRKRDACIAQLDSRKRCETCNHERKKLSSKPCKSCYNMLLGMPVNPTNWEPKSQQREAGK